MYACDVCSALFSNREECRIHEKECYPCNKCQHQYFVYGCEETCDYRDRKECTGDDCRSSLFKAKFLDTEE